MLVLLKCVYLSHMGTMTRKKLLIEGLRGINHSYALVNQNQLLQLRNSHFESFHNDLPFYNHKWSKALNGSGFDESSSQQLSNIPSLDNNLIQSDITYRISFPYRFYSGNTKRLFVYGTFIKMI